MGPAKCVADTTTERKEGFLKYQKIGVQCCSDNDPTGSRPGCMSGVTFHEAQAWCAENKLRLCKDEELNLMPRGTDLGVVGK